MTFGYIEIFLGLIYKRKENVTCSESHSYSRRLEGEAGSPELLPSNAFFFFPAAMGTNDNMEVY